MRRARFRFYAELNDFLPPQLRYRDFEHCFALPGSVKDMIESVGVPHPEVELLLINGASVSFSASVSEGDMVSAYPHFRLLDVSGVSLVAPEPLPAARFVLDIHLGRLATYLRMAGFDTLYRNDYEDEELAELSAREPRILLTADRGLLKRGIVTHGYYVRSRQPREQLLEVFRRYDLLSSVSAFTRCLECNAPLVTTSKNAVLNRLEPRTRELYTEFSICTVCNRVYWKGSHYEHMRKVLEAVASG
ncbi:MAG TPA: Mut7-C RNAse domain-containing protein [Terriglobales bacterium]|jgi:uncharacterized protein with PIN domain|nr:Mut7-C RNAse domain-containing protein [Terriglobales bacterium]